MGKKVKRTTPCHTCTEVIGICGCEHDARCAMKSMAMATSVLRSAFRKAAAVVVGMRSHASRPDPAQCGVSGRPCHQHDVPPRGQGEGRVARLSVAPMMEWTDRHYRYLARLLTSHTELYTEMISDSAVV
jgi:hypothetical protein